LNLKLLDATIRNQVYLEQLKAGQVGRFTKFLKSVNDDLKRRLTQDDLTEYSRTRFNRLLSSVNKNLDDAFKGFQQQLELDLVDVGEYEAQFEARSLENAINEAGFESVIPSTNQVKAAIFSQPLSVRGADGGKLLKPFVADWSKADKARVIGTIRQGYFEGQTNFQILKNLQGTKARNYQDGVLGVVGRNGEAIIRTSVQHVASVSRFETWEQNKSVVKGYEWRSTLDSRTSTICRTLDGETYQIGHGPKPPAHIRCRSTTIASLDKKYDFLDEGRTRYAKGGNVDANQDYYDWLKDQTEEFQDDVLGPVRGKLFRDGGLGAERFRDLQLDKRFRPITLDEMRKKEPDAFKLAFGGDGTKTSVVKTPVAKKSVKTFEPLPSTSMVETWLVENKYAGQVQLGKLDVSVANEMAQSWVYHVEKFPELRGNMGFMGSMQTQNKMYYDRQYAHNLERAKRVYPDADPHMLAKRWTRRSKSDGRAWAHATRKGGHKIYEGMDGICFNEKFGATKGLKLLEDGLTRSLQTKFHPVGCDTAKSIIDHEVGHQLDYLMGLSKNPDVVNMWKDWGRNADTLSTYAGENIQEFIAESWAEYLNNPSPRPVAKKLGDFIEKTYKERFKG